jgi:hypothetical protein
MSTPHGIRCLFLLLAPLLGSCALTEKQQQDRLCRELAVFAALTGHGQRSSVVLRGGWGGDSEGHLVTRDCTHASYRPGEVLCAYLLPNTSWEFGERNAMRAAQCLDSPERESFVQHVEDGAWPVVITSSLQQLTDKNIRMTLRLERAASWGKWVSGVSVFTISVTREFNRAESNVPICDPFHRC